MRRLQTYASALAFFLLLSACGGPKALPPAESLPEPYPPFNDSNSVCYEANGLQIALPADCLEQLIVDDTPRYEASLREHFLLSVSEKASIEAAKADFGDGSGFGYLFGLAVMDQAGLEQFLCSDSSGSTVFATDGEQYYIYTEPTDVQYYRSGGESESGGGKTWEELSQIGPLVREDFITRNGLQSFSLQDYTDQLAAEDGNHVCVRYYPYFLKDGDTRVYYQLLLHQPARQGSGGIWAVDQWLDECGNRYLYFPDSGIPSAEYYAQLQKSCDSEESPALRTLGGAASAFVKDYFGHETTEGSFETGQDVNYLYIDINKRLQTLAQRLYFGDSVSETELLECVGQATGDNWGVLGRFQYGSDWFTPLMDAVADASTGEDQQWRDKMVLSFYLATGETQTDFQAPLSGILRSQKNADPEAYQAALAEFSEEEQEILLGAPLGVRSAPSMADLPEMVEPLDTSGN